MTENKLLVDVETANDTDCALTYDISTRLVTLDNTILTEHAFVVRDIFCDMRDVVKEAYYADKIDEYITDIQHKEREMFSFMGARRIILDEMAQYNCKTVVAYNCRFDRNALNNTLRYLTKSRFRWGGINVDNCKSANNKNCLMAMYRAAKKKKHFIHVALKRHRIKIRINHGKRG